jgi:nucleotide-binding universal stress UspA family protein
MRVLIATDGSDLAIHAASEAPALLAADATFVVATVIAPTMNPEDDAGGFEGPVITPEDAADEHRSDVVDADGVLASTAAALGSVPIEQLIVEGTGNAGTALCARAAESAFDLIVVGSHGRGLIARAFMGSVSSYIVSHAPCPVLVIRAQDS